MSWKCEKCGQKLKGKEKFCPECSEKVTYKCKECGKIMDNGKYKYCPICSTARAEKRSEAMKKTGSAIVAVGTIAIAVVTKGRRGGKA